MHDFCMTSGHILHSKRNRALDTVQIIIQSHAAHDNHRSRHPEQCQLSRKIVLKHILDGLDCLFCIFHATQDIAVAFRYNQ